MKWIIRVLRLFTFTFLCNLPNWNGWLVLGGFSLSLFNFATGHVETDNWCLEACHWQPKVEVWLRRWTSLPWRRWTGGTEKRPKTFFRSHFIWQYQQFWWPSFDRGSLMKKKQFQSSDMYTWLVLVMGVFYAIPALQVLPKNSIYLDIERNICICIYSFLRVYITKNLYWIVSYLQLTLNNEQELYLTGNQDLCYYNFKCARPVSNWVWFLSGAFSSYKFVDTILSENYINSKDLNLFTGISFPIPFKVTTLADFNHFFSNIGYIAFGLIFLILVRWQL